MNVISRFEGGVHDRDKCGKNLSGYAAIEASLEHGNVHLTDAYSMGTSAYSGNRTFKRRVHSNDRLLYSFFLLSETMPDHGVYVIFATNQIPLHGVLRSVFCKLVSRGSLILVIETHALTARVNMYTENGLVTGDYQYQDEVESFLSMMSSSRSRAAICHPYVTTEAMQLINNYSPHLWCFPVNRHSLVVSGSGEGNCSYSIAPWSRPGLASGYAIGCGTIVRASLRQVLDFEERANYYDNFVSDCPVNGSCTDCLAMSRISSIIAEILGIEPVKKARHKSINSIVALEEINEMIRKAASSVES